MKIKMPLLPAVARLLTDLVGRNVTPKSAPGAKPPVGPQAVAAYVDPAGALLAVALCDVPSGASLGAALVLIPPASVEDAVKAKQLDPSLTENLYEVLNVFSSIFPISGGPRVLLRALITDGKLPDDVVALMAKPAQRLDMDVTVAGYLSGRMTLMAA